MKLATNLIAPTRRWIRLAAWTLWILASAVLVSAADMALTAYSAHERLPDLEARVAALEKQEAGARAAGGDASVDRMLQVRLRVSELNRVFGASGEAPLTLLNRLESMLPDSCYLTRLSYKQASGQGVLAVESTDSEALSRFLARLEQAPQLKDVSLLKQERFQSGDRTVVRNELGFRDRI